MPESSLDRFDSNPQIVGPDRIVGAQFGRRAGLDDVAFAHDVHIVDQLERKMGVLLDQ